jgi:hypothetical protein
MADGIAQRRPKGAKSAALAAGALMALAAMPFGCPRSVEERPVVSLASSTEAEARFASVRLRWATATPADRASMRPELNELVTFLDKTDDGLEDLARAYLAIAWLDAGVPGAAEAVARPLVEGAPGVAHDLATLVKGAAERRTGHSADAIVTLRPLAGKLIDPFARPILYEELVEALLDEGRFDEALVFAEAWLRAGAGGNKPLQATVARVLKRIPEAVASRVLEAERQAKGAGGHSPELLLILSDRVDELIAASPAEDAGTVTPSEAGVSVAAADAAVLSTIPGGAPIRFDPRAIALLVPSSAPGVAVITASIVRAAAATTNPITIGAKADAGASAPSSTSHRLAVFDTGGTATGTGRALEAAERDGAALVIGGATDLEANALAQLAQMRHIGVILLRKPPVVPVIASGDRQMWIALGASSDEEAKATLAIADGFSGDKAIVEPYPLSPSTPSADPLRVRCDATAKTVDTTAFPIAAWRAKKVPTIVLLGDLRCSKRLLAELTAVTPGAPYRPHLVLSPSSLELVHENLPLSRSAVSAGVLPATDDAPATLRALWMDQGAPVGWWNALGHDAATLALAATPGDLLATTDPAALLKARANTLSRLLAAKVELWTTSSSGVGPSGLIPRTMVVRAVGAGGAWHPSWLADDDHPVYK